MPGRLIPAAVRPATPTLLLSVLGAFAEFERALIRERQLEGIALAKARGAYTGRKPSLTPGQAEALRARAAAGEANRGAVITITGPKPLGRALRRLRRASRAHARKQPGSANRRSSAARLARVHARVACLRADALHKATSMLATQYQTIVCEDLNVAGMTRNRRLARAIADQGFGAARRMLGYKTAWNGGTLIVADRWFPSTRTCSGCGAVKAKLPLSERVFICESCGLVLDRDVNAAINLRDLAASGAESLNAWGGCVRPGPAGRRPLNQEPGTAHAGKTGTAAGQPAAARSEFTHVHSQRRRRSP